MLGWKKHYKLNIEVTEERSEHNRRLKFGRGDKYSKILNTIWKDNNLRIRQHAAP